MVTDPHERGFQVRPGRDPTIKIRVDCDGSGYKKEYTPRKGYHTATVAILTNPEGRKILSFGGHWTYYLDDISRSKGSGKPLCVDMGAGLVVPEHEMTRVWAFVEIATNACLMQDNRCISHDCEAAVICGKEGCPHCWKSPLWACSTCQDTGLVPMHDGAEHDENFWLRCDDCGREAAPNAAWRKA